MDGVEAVFTGAQIAELLAADADRHARSRRPPIAPSPSTSSATPASRWRWSSPSDRYVARDAADAIVVDYDTLPAVVDPELAMTGQADGHPRGLSEQHRAVPLVPSGTGVSADGKTVDDSAIDKAFADAEVVISQRMLNQRLVPNAMEPRGVVAHYEPGQGIADDLVVDAEPAHPADA